MADIITGLGINIFGNGYTGGVGQTGLGVDVSNNALKVDPSSFTQPIVGTGVAGTAASGVVTIQGISGMVPLSINGTITASPAGTQSIIGTGTAGTDYTNGILTIQGTTTGIALPVSVKEITSGNVNNFNNIDVGSSSSGTVVTKSVASGSFVLKSVQASSSAGPVKVVVRVANVSTTTTISVGFFSSANPYIDFNYPQGYVVSSGNTVQVLGFNNAVATQTIYSFINGLDI
jgi:hypothetical protein